MIGDISILDKKNNDFQAPINPCSKLNYLELGLDLIFTLFSSKNDIYTQFHIVLLQRPLQGRDISEAVRPHALGFLLQRPLTITPTTTVLLCSLFNGSIWVQFFLLFILLFGYCSICIYYFYN